MSEVIMSKSHRALLAYSLEEVLLVYYLKPIESDPLLIFHLSSFIFVTSFNLTNHLCTSLFL